MYVEKFLRREDRKLQRKLRWEKREKKQEELFEQYVEETRKVFERYIEEARNDPKLINQIPDNPSWSLYWKLVKEYEKVEEVLYDGLKKPSAFSVELAKIVVCSIYPCLALIIGAVVARESLLLWIVLVAILTVIMFALENIIDGLSPRFSKKELWLAAESKVVCEYLTKRLKSNIDDVQLDCDEVTGGY